MENNVDFLDKVTLLQEILSWVGVTVNYLPKCHAKLMSKGIKYSWGFAKNAYRWLLLCKKRTNNFFRKSFRAVLSRDNITTERVRLFARRAQGYLCAYYWLHLTQTAIIVKKVSKYCPYRSKRLWRISRHTDVTLTLRESSMWRKNKRFKLNCSCAEILVSLSCILFQKVGFVRPPLVDACKSHENDTKSCDVKNYYKLVRCLCT